MKYKKLSNTSVKIRKFKFKASILIANYNNQIYLKECIRSLKRQTYKNLEIIFHDDCSSDNSLRNVKKLRNVKVIENKKRTKFGCYNQIKAYRKAFKKSTGDIIFLLDSDDFFSKKKVENIIKIFSDDDKISSIFDLQIVKSDKKLSYKKNKNKIIENYWPYIPPTSCISIRRKNFMKIIKEIEFKLFPDIWMDFRIAIYSKYISKNFFILNENLTYYRQTPQMISAKFKFLSMSWWKRRMQAHEYVKYFFLKNKIKHKKNLDYFLTYFMSIFIK